MLSFQLGGSFVPAISHGQEHETVGVRPDASGRPVISLTPKDIRSLAEKVAVVLRSVKL